MTKQTLPSSPAGRIALLLTRSDLGEEELARILDLPADVPGSAVLSGDYVLSPSDLVALADVLDVPATVLSGQVPLDRHLGVSLRLGTVDAPDAPDEALYYADRVLRYRSVLDSWLNAPPSPGSSIDVSTHGFYKRAGQESAERLREGLQLGDEPITDLVGLTEELGFPVVFRPLPEGMHGLNVQDAREGTVTRLIIVSTQGPWTLQRYTLAHELCHALYDDDGQVIVDYVDIPDRLPELRAEVFARHLLLPMQALKHDVGIARRVGASWAVMTAHLMVRWGMSRKAVLRALEDDGLAGPVETLPIRSRSIDSLMAEAGLSERWEGLSAGQSESSGSPQLVSRALEAYSRGLVGARVVAELLGQDIEVTREELLAQGWSDPEPAGG
jgi:hypothetical protein